MGDAPTAGDAPVTFADHILFHARARRERPAVVLPDRIATYDMIAQGMLRVEDRLGALGLTSGEVVCVALQSPIRHLIVTAALFRLGFPTVSAETAEEIIALRLPVRTYLQDAGESLTPGLRRILVDEDWFAGERRAVSSPAGFTSDDDLCRIEISSGSTGLPKAMSTTVGEFHRRLATQFVTAGMGVRDRVLGLPRISGAWGFRVAAHTLASGGTLVCAESAREALHMASVYSVDAILASTQQVRDLIREQKRAPVSCPSLRAVQLSGALPTRALLAEARARLCAQVIVHYGATEVGPAASTPADLLMEVEGATGYALPGARIEIVDSEDRLLPAETHGVVRVRTNAMARLYPPAPPEAYPQLRDGWFYPGDRGHMTEDGLLILEGRTSELINTGGVKRAPELIEEVVLRHPNVAEAAAFGALGPDGIEEVNLAIVARAPISAEHLIEWCAARGIEVAQVFAIDALPRTPMGKIRRDELKSRLVR